jgi:hypothetical protein
MCRTSAPPKVHVCKGKKVTWADPALVGYRGQVQSTDLLSRIKLWRICQRERQGGETAKLAGAPGLIADIVLNLAFIVVVVAQGVVDLGQ